jgi:hypothetical protein
MDELIVSRISSVKKRENRAYRLSISRFSGRFSCGSRRIDRRGVY